MGVSYLIGLLIAALPKARIGFASFAARWWPARSPVAPLLAAVVLVATFYAHSAAFDRATIVQHPLAYAVPILFFHTDSGVDASDANIVLVLTIVESLALTLFVLGLEALGRRGGLVAMFLVAAALAAIGLHAIAEDSPDPYLYVGQALLGIAAYHPPAVPFPGDLATINQIWSVPIQSTAYGPLWILVSHVAIGFAPSLAGKLFALRLLGLAAIAGCAALAARLGLPRSIVAAVSCNPALYDLFVAGAHNDLFGVDFVLWAMVALKRGNVIAGTFFAAYAGLVKITLFPVAAVAAMFLPSLIGAGVSQPHLGHDWDGVSAVLANDLGSSMGSDNIEIAQRYCDQLGRTRLIERLRELLMIDKYLDRAGDSLIAIANFGLRTYYTTNPDNVFEKYCERYNLNLTSVVQLEDLRYIRPGSLILYKFHGDFQNPDSVVWTTEDYINRASTGDDNFLNIRLKSDLLVKSLFFIGYSIRDAHITCILDDFARLYPSALRGSYVVAMGDTTAMRTRTAGLDVAILGVRDLYPDAVDDAHALAQLLTELNSRVITIRASRDLQSVFNTSSGLSIATTYEIDNVLKTIPTMQVTAAIHAFRALVNGRQIPRDFEMQIAQAYVALAERIVSEEDAHALAMAQFGLSFQNSNAGMLILYATYALRHITGFALGRDLAHVTTVIDQPFVHAMGVAGAAELLKTWKRPLNGEFANWVVHQIQDVAAIDTLEPVLQDQIKLRFAEIFKGSPRTDPMSRSLPDMYKTFKRRSFEEIQKSMIDAMPQMFRPPDENR